MTSSATGQHASRVGDVWYERGWPVLAGVTTAVGCLDLSQLIGLPAVALMVAGLWFFFAVVLYGAGAESGLPLRTVVRVTLMVAVSIPALLGLTDLFPVGGWFIALAMGVTSPSLAHHAGPRLRRGLQRFGRPTASDHQAAVDRAFGAIVAKLAKGDA